MVNCTRCGAVIQPPNARFCGACGAPVLSTPPVQSAPSMPPPPPPSQPASYMPPVTQISPPSVTPQPQLEKVVGVIVLRQPKSMGRYDSYTGIVTTQRMIFAQMTAEMLKAAVQMARDQAKAEGKGFWGQWSDQLKVSFSYAQRYMSMDPNVALSETPGNRAISNSAISEVKLHLKDINRGNENDLHEFELEVLSAQGRFTFRIDKRNEYPQLLKQVYGEKVKMPFGYFSSGITIGR